MSDVAAPAKSSAVPPGEALAQADRLRGEGRLAEAEALCRQVLNNAPATPEAEHLLGIIAHQNGKLTEAIEHIQRAVTLAPQVALFHANLGEMLRLAGRPSVAVAAAQRALEIEPTMAMALSNLERIPVRFEHILHGERNFCIPVR